MESWGKEGNVGIMEKWNTERAGFAVVSGWG